MKLVLMLFLLATSSCRSLDYEKRAQSDGLACPYKLIVLEHYDRGFTADGCGKTAT